MTDTIGKTIDIHKKLLAEFEQNCQELINSAVELIVTTITNGGCIYLCGNGGSASDAQHVAGEFVGRFLKERKAIPAIALNTDGAVVTAIGNDYSYEEIFKRQLEAFIKPGDIFWAFSTSGSSKNIIAAAKLATERDAKIIGFTGKKNTPLEALSDVCISLDAPYSAPAQEIHMLAYHIICDLVEQHFSS